MILTSKEPGKRRKKEEDNYPYWQQAIRKPQGTKLR
jgi:hypothetical protein